MFVSLIEMKGESVLEKRIKFHQKNVFVYRIEILLKSELWFDYKKYYVLAS